MGRLMQYVKLGHTGLEVSPLCIGAMSYGEPDSGHPYWSLDDEVRQIEAPYTPRHDFQGVSDPKVLKQISERVGIKTAS